MDRDKTKNNYLCPTSPKQGPIKQIFNILRTTQRNNVERTAIADNKANVLLGLNALMLSIVLPLVLSNLEYIQTNHLQWPVLLMVSTCFITILISSIVLMPHRVDKIHRDDDPIRESSPFYYGNVGNMKPKEFYDYIQENLNDQEDLKRFLAQDMYYNSKRLLFKMLWIRRAFILFLIGLFVSVLSLIWISF